MSERRVRLDLAYVGTGFHGWQIQPGLRTVQGELAACLEALLGRPCRPTGAGRTDTGVHARGQVAHVTLATAAEVARIVRSLPRMAPADIHIHGAREVALEFDARLSATGRRYSYHLLWRRNLFRPFAFHVRWPLDAARIDRACAHLRGTHDFSSLCRTASLKDDNRCTVDLCELEWGDDGGIFHVRANRFLHNMVRNLVALLVDIGRGARDPDEIPEILAARDRARAAGRAPAHGLFLEEVTYPGGYEP